MKYKHIAYTLVLALTGTLVQAQVKIGKNPTTITPGALLDIEGNTTTTRTVSLTNGNFGIGTVSPVAKLDVGGNLAFNNSLTNGQITGAGDVMYMRRGTAGFIVQANDGSANELVLTSGNLGIGVTPSAKLDVAGKVRIADGTQGQGKVLTSDANGVASWASGAVQNLRVYFNGFTTSNGNARDLVRLPVIGATTNSIPGSAIANGDVNIFLPAGTYRASVTVSGQFNGSSSSNAVTVFISVNGSPYQSLGGYSTTGTNGSTFGGTCIFVLPADGYVTFVLDSQTAVGGSFSVFGGSDRTSATIERLQ